MAIRISVTERNGIYTVSENGNTLASFARLMDARNGAWKRAEAYKRIGAVVKLSGVIGQ